MNFLLVFAIIYLAVALPVKLGKQIKAQQEAQQEAQKARQARTSPQGPAKAPYKEIPKPAPAPMFESEEGSSFRPPVMEPTITVTEHDDSVYLGSMNASTGEGYDPCHDEQLAPLTAAKTMDQAADTEGAGLHLSWTGSDVINGIVMSEILKRK